MKIDGKAYKSAVNNARRGQIKSLTEKLDQYHDLGTYEDDHGDSPLIREAVAADQEKVVELLLSRRAFPVRPDGRPDLDSSLSLAVARGKIEIVDRLIDAGADVNVRVRGNHSLLIDMCFDAINYPEEYMLAGNAEWTANIKAFRTAKQDIFFHLVERGAVIDKPYTILAYAAGGGLSRIVRHLLEKVITVYPEPSETNGATKFRSPHDREFGDSALAWAVRRGQHEIFQWLFERGGAEGNCGEDGRDALYCAVCANLPDVVRQLIRAGVSTDPGLYCQETDRIPVYATPAEMARALYERNRKNTYFEYGFDPGESAFVNALIVAIETLPKEVYPLIIVSQFQFVYSLLKQMQIEVMSDPNKRAAFIKEREESVAGTELEEDEVKEPFVELLQAREEVVTTTLRDGIVTVREERPLIEVLRELESAMRVVDQRTASSVFNKGLAKRKIGSLWKNAKSPLPDDLVALYAWRNGAGRDSGEFFHGYRFFSMEKAMVTYRQTRSLYSSVFFPVMQDIFGCTVQFDMRQDHHAGLVYESDVDAFDQPIIYPSLNAYFAALATCFREGVFRVVRDAKGNDVLVGYGDRMDAVFKRYALRLPDDKVVEEPEANDGTEEGVVGESVYDYRIPLR